MKAANEPKFRPGDRVVHVTASEVPEGAKGTVLGVAPHRPDLWEVEYDGLPCHHAARHGYYADAKSETSWFSRETSIELTTEDALRRAFAAS